MTAIEQIYLDCAPYDGDPLADDMGGPAGRVHDWRNYVGDLGDVWSALSQEARMAAAIVAQSVASGEEWD